MARNDDAASTQDWPGIRIHAIDIFQPPGMGIAPMSDMDLHQMVVNAALRAKSSAETLRKTCSEVRSKAMDRDLLSRHCDVLVTGRTRRGAATRRLSRCGP